MFFSPDLYQLISIQFHPVYFPIHNNVNIINLLFLPQKFVFDFLYIQPLLALAELYSRVPAFQRSNQIYQRDNLSQSGVIWFLCLNLLPIITRFHNKIHASPKAPIQAQHPYRLLFSLFLKFPRQLVHQLYFWFHLL